MKNKIYEVNLKIKDKYFQQIITGLKKIEIRKQGYGLKSGDFFIIENENSNEKLLAKVKGIFIDKRGQITTPWLLEQIKNDKWIAQYINSFYKGDQIFLIWFEVINDVI